MNSPYLPLVQKACVIDIEEAIPKALHGKIDRREMLLFSTWYRRMSITKLFLSGLPDEFFVDLFKSGRAFLHYLETHDDSAKATGQSAPFFDALSCNDLEGAKAIALASRADWNRDEEMPDEFYYFHFLMKRSVLGASETELKEILAAYEESLQGIPDSRLGVCKALEKKDAQGFNDAMVQLVRDQYESYLKGLSMDALDPDDVVTTERLSVEGLALVRIAEMTGLVTPKEIQLIPSVARMYGRASLPGPDAWSDVEAFYEQ